MISFVMICKDEPALDQTITAVEAQAAAQVEPTEIVVVDASSGRLDWIRQQHPDVRWHDFVRPEGVQVSIPHQRNTGVGVARGDVVVFIDSGCIPRPGWLELLLEPILAGEEQASSGVAVSPGKNIGLYDGSLSASGEHLEEFPTINVAVRREAGEKVGWFDEAFEYGSDLDFSWRLADEGIRARLVGGAVVEHDWGRLKRQLKRSFAYGKAKARLYRKHRSRLSAARTTDPMIFVYPVFLLGLPLCLLVPAYPLLLAVPLWRNRHARPFLATADHLVFGAGVLREIGGWLSEAAR